MQQDSPSHAPKSQTVDQDNLRGPAYHMGEYAFDLDTQLVAHCDAPLVLQYFVDFVKGDKAHQIRVMMELTLTLMPAQLLRHLNHHCRL